MPVVPSPTPHPSARPPVTVVLPTRDERAHIRDCLDTLLAQDYPGPLEILVVDGGSTDGTPTIAGRVDARVRVIDNPRVTAAAAMNLGVAEARTDLVVRADAHALYAPDYVRMSIESLLEGDMAVVGGPMRPVGITPFGRAVAAITSSPLGVGPGRFHYARERAEVDTVYLGAFDKHTIIEAGGYDEHELQWAAEDQELNLRIRAGGGRIVVDPAIKSWYFPRETPSALWRQYFNYGRCKASTLAKHGRLPHWRPLVPAAMVAGTAAVVVGAIVRRQPAIAVLPVAVYAAGAGAAAWHLARDPGVAPHRALGAIAICHWAHGLGFWAGIGRIALGRRFDTRPRGARI
ncbi:MAG: glycosyltransferase family 2 protein [Acidimicrobiia bacterium]